MIKSPVLLLVVVVCTTTTTASNVRSFASSSSQGGAAQSQSVGPDGLTRGECSYLDAQGRSVKIKYTEGQGGQVQATSPQRFVNDPISALALCRAQVARGQQDLQQGQLELQAALNEGQRELQQNLGGFLNLPFMDFVTPFINPQAQRQNEVYPTAGQGSTFPATRGTGAFASSSRPGAAVASGGGASVFSDGAGTSFVSSGGPGASFVSVGGGNGGASIVSVGGGAGTAESRTEGLDGTVRGECAYMDARGLQVKVRYVEYPDKTVNVESDDKTVDPRAALNTCRGKVQQQQAVVEQQLGEVARQQQQLQQQLYRQQQQFEEQMRQQQQAIFGGGQFPFNFYNPFNDY